MTRVATPGNEAYLLMLARHGTASHVEKLVRNYRRVARRQAIRELGARSFSCSVDTDGAYVIRARLTAEQGRRLLLALDATTDAPAENDSRTFTMRHVDAHHVRHWADGGETRIDNLVLLCRHHHRLVHEGGFGVQLTAAGDKHFYRPDGRRLPHGQDERFRGNVTTAVQDNRQAGIRIGPRSLPPLWRGETMDPGMAIDALLRRDGAGPAVDLAQARGD